MPAFRTVKGAQFAGKLMRIYIRVVAEKRNLGHSGGALVPVLVAAISTAVCQFLTLSAPSPSPKEVVLKFLLLNPSWFQLVSVGFCFWDVEFGICHRQGLKLALSRIMAVLQWFLIFIGRALHKAQQIPPSTI